LDKSSFAVYDISPSFFIQLNNIFDRSKQMARKKKGKATASGKVFRVTVLGRAEAGKSALCMRFVSNTALKLYEHTLEIQLYHREVDVRKLHPKSIGVPGAGANRHKNKKKTLKKKKKKGQVLTTYGIQIEDVPGEITGGIEERTAEKDTITRDTESNDGYKQLYHDTNGWLGVDEHSSLLFKKKKRVSDVEKHVNLLYIPMMTDGYIVVFDVQSTDSLSKAKALIKAIHQSPNKSAPILLLGNKTDIARSSAEVIRKASDFARNSRMHEIHFAHGSTHINQFEHEDEGMDCYNLMNEFVQKLHAKNRGVSSTQYNDKFQRGKKFGRGRGRGGLSGIDGEGEGKGDGCCSWLCSCFRCFQCCNCWGTEEYEEDATETGIV
jgi:GTPase SAR1 family protein